MEDNSPVQIGPLSALLENDEYVAVALAAVAKKYRKLLATCKRPDP